MHGHRFGVGAAAHIRRGQCVFEIFVDRAIGCLSWAEDLGLGAAGVNGAEGAERGCVGVGRRPAQRRAPQFADIGPPRVKRLAWTAR